MCSQFPMCLRSLEQEGASHFTGEGTAVLGGRPIWPASDGGVRQRWDLTWVSWTPEKHSSPWDCVCICSQEAWRATVQTAHCLRPSTPGRVSGLEPSIILDVRGRAAATQTTGSEAPSGTISFRGQLFARQQLPGSFGAVPIGPLLHGPVPGGCLLKGLRGRAIYGGDTLGRPVSGPTV